jgi:capsule biosynthesis phosphatase
MTNKLTIIYDLDGTLCETKRKDQSYADVEPILPMIQQLNEFYDQGHEIMIHTARNMVTQNNNVAKVIQNVGEVTLEWLRRHGVKYHGIEFGKIYGQIYIDDKACLNNPQEIAFRVLEELKKMNKEKQ